MSPRSNPKAHRRRHFSFYILHRYLGLFAALFVLLLAITGIMLNHTEALRLDERTIHSDKILEWYGINTAIPERGYQLGKHWISHQNQSVFFDERLLDLALIKLTGAVTTDQLFVISGEEKVVLLTQEGELVDVMDHSSGLPAGKILRMGFSNTQQLVLETEQGILVASSDFLTWQKSEVTDFKWSQQARLPEVLQTTMAKNWRGEGVTLERLTLDLHSGRLFGGTSGVLLMDLAALIMIFLAFTGVWMWAVRWRKRRIHRASYKRHREEHI